MIGPLKRCIGCSGGLLLRGRLWFRPHECAMSVGGYSTLCLETVLASQPFRQWPRADSYLSAPQHRTEESHLGEKVSLRIPPCLAFDYDRAPGGPEQSPLRGKVLHLDHIGWTQIIAAPTHSGTRIFPDSLL